MTSSGAETRAISARVRKSKRASPLEALCRMLRNTLRSWPSAKLLHGQAGFGATLDAGQFVWIRYSGQLSAQDLRDLLALFATWCVVDPERLMGETIAETNGASYMDSELSYLSSGRLGSHGIH